MSRSLALTGIALIAASLVTGGSAALASVPGPGVPHGRDRHGDAQRPGHIAPRAPATRHRPAAHGLGPGCTRVAGGVQCVTTRGFDRDWVFNDGDDKDPTRSLIDPKD